MGVDSLRRARVPLALMLIMVGVLIGSYSYGPSARALPVLVAWTTIGLLLLDGHSARAPYRDLSAEQDR